MSLRNLLDARAKLVNHLVVHPDDTHARRRKAKIEGIPCVAGELTASRTLIAEWRKKGN